MNDIAVGDLVVCKTYTTLVGIVIYFEEAGEYVEEFNLDCFGLSFAEMGYKLFTIALPKVNKEHIRKISVKDLSYYWDNERIQEFHNKILDLKNLTHSETYLRNFLRGHLNETSLLS